LVTDLLSLVEASTRGDPESPLLWTCKSTPKLAAELQAQGHQVSQQTVWRLLESMDDSLPANHKVPEGGDEIDRDAQLLHMAALVKPFQRQHQPVIAGDGKKKAVIGQFKNAGEEWSPKGEPIAVNADDFVDKKLGKALPYGVYDLYLHQGWGNVGIDHDTAQFAVESSRRWWYEMGLPIYPQAQHLLMTADCGGSNGYRVKLWKLELQHRADETGLTIHVCHFPPGTSKWNKIEPSMFCHISQNWRGRPLTSRQVVVKLISHPTTKTGLRIQAKLDKHHYPTGIEVSDEELNSIAIERDNFHGDWNYRIKPKSQQ
jgi:Rhodopirellula transposase DDE domain